MAGRGLEGDRFFSKIRTWSGGRLVALVTLIELETIETLKRDHAVEFGLGDSRRNIVTRGVPLTHLVGRGFRIGDVRLPN